DHAMNVQRILAIALLVSCLCLGVGCRQSGSRSGDEVVGAAGALARGTTATTQESGSAPATTGPDVGAPKPAASAGTSPGKPLPPIAFDYRILGTAVAGEPLEIEIITGVEDALADLNVALSGNERLLVPIEMARLRLTAAVAGQRSTRTIRVTPVVAGTVYLDVLLQAEVGGRLQSRAVTIPIRVGDAPTPETPMGTLSTDAEGVPIISLPGREN
ncbi:MAG TPA: hypothetical protein VLD39_16945, partial [Gammaproteobacteria bacterium]|nr:hypothetical protein [Gammaproteobacteria bacterium]